MGTQKNRPTDGCFEHPNQMFKLMDTKITADLRSKILTIIAFAGHNHSFPLSFCVKKELLGLRIKSNRIQVVLNVLLNK